MNGNLPGHDYQESGEQAFLNKVPDPATIYRLFRVYSQPQQVRAILLRLQNKHLLRLEHRHRH
jgi:hypothetical protein